MSDLLHYAETLKAWIRRDEVAINQPRALEIVTELAATVRRDDDALRAIKPVYVRLMAEVARQDEKHGRFEGTVLGRSRLALACLEDETREAVEAWRGERKGVLWEHTREEVLQVAAVAIRALRDAL